MIPAYLLPEQRPEPTTATVCSVCAADWDLHLRAASARWDRMYGVEAPEPGVTFPPVSVELGDCIVALRSAAQGPEGPAGPMGATGMSAAPPDDVATARACARGRHEMERR